MVILFYLIRLEIICNTLGVASPWLTPEGSKGFTREKRLGPTALFYTVELAPKTASVTKLLLARTELYGPPAVHQYFTVTVPESGQLRAKPTQ